MSVALKDRLLADLKSAMKKGQKSQVQALKLVLSECKNREIELKSDFSSAHVVHLLQKQVKQYEESMEQCRKAGKDVSFQENRERRDLIKSYLPAMLSDLELKKMIEIAVKELKVLSIKDMGRVMKSVQAQAKGPLDRGRLAELVQKRLKAL